MFIAEGLAIQVGTTLFFLILSFFLIASSLCSAAQSMNWLIICRAVQGTEREGALQLIQNTISDIKSLEEYMELSYSVILPYNVFLDPLIGGVCH